MDPNLISFLLSLGASISWDGIKLLLSKINRSSKEYQSISSITNTMKQFHEINSYKYDEDAVMTAFIESTKTYKDWIWTFRDVIESAIGKELSDEEFRNWIDIYEKNLQIPIKRPFTDRNSLKEKIRLELDDDIHSHGKFYDIIYKIIDKFNSSWKQDIINIFEKYNISTPFAKGNQSCNLILKSIKEIFNNLDIDKISDDDYKLLSDYIENPNYNRVLLISGTSGCGKTHFLTLYKKSARTLLERNIAVAIPCHISIRSIHTIQDDLINALYILLNVKCNTLEEYCNLLDVINIKIAFVIENVNSLINNKVISWSEIVSVIEDVTRFDHYKFIITINEYEYFQIEKDITFLNRYCIENLESLIFKRCINIDEINKEKKIVDIILNEDYSVDSEFQPGISTPLEAIYYGECAKGQHLSAPPSCYYEYIEKITQWKDEEIGLQNIEKILDSIISQKNSIVKTNEDVIPFRNAQLLTLESKKSMFDLQPTYHLRIYPYWAAKIIGYNEFNILSYSDDLKEWLIPCYIFYHYIDHPNEELHSFFDGLNNVGLLDYAVFCAHKASYQFIHDLKSYLLSIEINTPRLCYAILRYIEQCPLKISEKFELCVHISEKLDEFGIIDFYSRTLDSILISATSPQKIRRNMLSFVSCNLPDINCINGYKIGKKHMILCGKTDIYTVTSIIISIIISHDQLNESIANSNNEGFLDFFLRECFEYYIVHHPGELKKIYSNLRPLFDKTFPIGIYIKRNLTCAAGNIFENRDEKNYRDEYIELVRRFILSDEKYTAWFLIKNSVGKNEKKLDPTLYEMLDDLKNDSEIKRRFNAEIDELIKWHT